MYRVEHPRLFLEAVHCFNNFRARIETTRPCVDPHIRVRIASALSQACYCWISGIVASS